MAIQQPILPVLTWYQGITTRLATVMETVVGITVLALTIPLVTVGILLVVMITREVTDDLD